MDGAAEASIESLDNNRLFPVQAKSLLRFPPVRTNYLVLRLTDLTSIEFWNQGLIL